MPDDHKFAGIDCEENSPPLRNDPPGSLRYRGRCTCGHAEHWTTDKDWAWQEIASHILPYLLKAMGRSQ
jgi:hypothetical protein